MAIAHYFLVFIFQCDSTFNKDKKMTYSCVYIPQMEGDFRVRVIPHNIFITLLLGSKAKTMLAKQLHITCIDYTKKNA